MMRKALTAACARIRSMLRGEHGFALIELMVALFVMAIGITAMVGALDSSRRLVTLSERKEAAVTIGEQEIERIESLDYSEVALSAAPAGSSDPKSPALYVSAGPPPTYRWDQPAGAIETLAVDPAAGALAGAPTAWSDSRLSGTLHRFVTWVDDPSCSATLCPGAQDYKRVTVAVTVDGVGGPDKPILLSTKVTDPDSAPAGYVSDGKENPLDSPSTTCSNDAGQQVECAGGIGSGVANTVFLYDTPASSDQRQPISGAHATHPTVAPSSACAGQGACPIPDLLGVTPAPAAAAGEPAPPLLSYSDEWTGAALPGGRVLVRDTACSATPSANDNQRGGYWVTPPVDSNSVLTGNGGLTLYSQGLGAAGSRVSLCLAFYDQPGALGGTAPTQIGRVTHTLESWPAAIEAVSFSFDFRGADGNVTIASGRRIGVRLWVSGDSQQDIAAVYDHPARASALQLNSTAAAPPGGPRWTP